MQYSCQASTNSFDQYVHNPILKSFRSQLMTSNQYSDSSFDDQNQLLTNLTSQRPVVQSPNKNNYDDNDDQNPLRANLTSKRPVVQSQNNSDDDENLLHGNLTSQRPVIQSQNNNDDDTQEIVRSPSGFNKKQSYLDQLEEDQAVRRGHKPQNDLENREKGLLNKLQGFVKDQFIKLIREGMGSNNDSHFYGLDDRRVDLDQIKLADDGRIIYKSKQDLKIVTFLISGYLTQDFEASENFKILAKLLESCLKESFSQIVTTGIYWLIKLLSKCIQLIGSSYFKYQINVFKTALDTIIDDFQFSFEQAKNGGAVLAEYINKQSLMNNLSIDFMGHSLGTVVTAYTLQNLSQPARYLMLFGGAATITEIQSSDSKFQKCYNFYSTCDNVIKTFLVKAKLIGDNLFVGVNKFGINENYKNLNTQIDHVDYMNKYQEYYNLAMMEFESCPNKINLPEKLDNMKIGLGSLLLYLFCKNKKSYFT
ncbi:hypothetical protein ABPG74_003109 [Tetrahymena malaccensis]